MAGSQHEAMHHLFRHDPDLFTRTFHHLNLPFEEAKKVELLPNEFNELDVTRCKPLLNRFPDTALRVTVVTGDQFVLIVEAQRDQEKLKPSAWAYYLAHAEAVYGLPVVLTVICRDRPTAAWAAGPFHHGLPQWPCLTVRPLVLGPDNVPRVVDPEVAAQDPALAVLSGITHAEDDNADAILKALAAALLRIDSDEASTFVELITRGLEGTHSGGR